jgi:hypothetical protein
VHGILGLAAKQQNAIAKQIKLSIDVACFHTGWA